MRNEAREIEAADAYHESMHPEPDGDCDDDHVEVWLLLDALLGFPFDTGAVLWSYRSPHAEAAMRRWAAQNSSLVRIDESPSVDAISIVHVRTFRTLLRLYRQSPPAVTP